MYCTIQDIKDWTLDSNLGGESDERITSLIGTAEAYIDSYVRCVKKADLAQVRKFPRKQDNDAIPENVKFATCAQVEFIYLQLPDADHGIKEDESDQRETISPRAKELLKGFRSLIGNVDLPENDPLNYG